MPKGTKSETRGSITIIRHNCRNKSKKKASKEEKWKGPWGGVTQFVTGNTDR